MIDLRTSLIKLDAEDTDLRLCFRIISPQKTYTLQVPTKSVACRDVKEPIYCYTLQANTQLISQAENGADRMDWVNKITAAIATRLNSHFLQQVYTKPSSKASQVLRFLC